jgi:transposase
VHCEFAEVAIWQDGEVHRPGQVAATPVTAAAPPKAWRRPDEVAIEATCNTHAIAKLLEGRVAKVVISNLQKPHAIAEANVKTDKVDAAVLAQRWRPMWQRSAPM